MVISHHYKYLFIENGQTGCSAIRKELIENYKGKSILRKHSVYSEFLDVASPEEKDYTVFYTVRNPLDKSVSTFVKYKNNHRNRYTDRITLKGRQAIIDWRHLRNYNRIKNDNFSYKDYLKSNKWLPYDDMSTLYKDKYHNVVRFESLNDDFKKVLIRMGISPVRDLPKFNQTKAKTDYLDFYDDLEIQNYSIEKFSVFMEFWDYGFPESWPKKKITRVQRQKWNFFHVLRRVSWGRLRKGLKDV